MSCLSCHAITTTVHIPPQQFVLLILRKMALPTTVFNHSRKCKPFDNLYIDNMQTRSYALLYHVLGNILPGKIGIEV